MAGRRAVPITEDSYTRSRQVPKRMRAYVLERDRYACRYCRASGQEVILEIDHVNPNGATTPRNLVAACRPCNRLKGGRTYRNAYRGIRWEPLPLMAP